MVNSRSYNVKESENNYLSCTQISHYPSTKFHCNPSSSFVSNLAYEKKKKYMETNEQTDRGENLNGWGNVCVFSVWLQSECV